MRQTHLILASLVAGTIGFTALAQPAGTKEGPKGEPAKAPAARPNRGPGGAGPMGLEPEKAKAAWEAEATAVAKRLKMNDDQTKAVVKTYQEARESFQAALTKANEDFRANGGGGAGNPREIMANVTKAEKEKFEKALGAAKFSADDTTKLSASLSNFSNRSWDRLTDAILGMKLDSDKQQQSLEAIETFVVEQTKINSKAGQADSDREANRTATTANNKKLTDTLGKILTAEQAKSIDELVARGMGNMRGGGAGGNRGGNGEKPADGEKKEEKKEGGK